MALTSADQQPRRARTASRARGSTTARRAPAQGRVHRHALQRRLLRALPGRAAGRARHRVPRVEHALPRQRGVLPPRARARRHRRRRALAARAGRRRHRRDPRQLRRRLADGRVPVAGHRPVHRGRRSACRCPTPCSTSRPPTSTSRSTRTRGGPRCSPRGWTRPSPTRPTRSRSTRPSTCSTRRTARRTHRTFVERYRAAQVARNDRITAWARGELERLRAAGAWDRVFNLAPRVGRPPLRRPHDRSVGPRRRLLRRRSPRPPTSGRSPSAAPARCARGCRCGASRRRSAAALRTSRASPSRRSSCSRSPTAACSPPTPAPSTTRSAADDKALELVPGEHYFEDTGPAAVADLVADLDPVARLITLRRAGRRGVGLGELLELLGQRGGVGRGALAVRMSSITNGAADRRMKPAATAIGTSVDHARLDARAGRTPGRSAAGRWRCRGWRTPRSSRTTRRAPVVGPRSR